jgi:hypothetical protein
MDVISSYREITNGFVKEINKITSIVLLQMFNIIVKEIETASHLQ